MHYEYCAAVLLWTTKANSFCIVNPLGFMNKKWHSSLMYFQLTFIRYLNTYLNLIILWFSLFSPLRWFLVQTFSMYVSLATITKLSKHLNDIFHTEIWEKLLKNSHSNCCHKYSVFELRFSIHRFSLKFFLYFQGIIWKSTPSITWNHQNYPLWVHSCQYIKIMPRLMCFPF